MADATGPLKKKPWISSGKIKQHGDMGRDGMGEIRLLKHDDLGAVVQDEAGV